MNAKDCKFKIEVHFSKNRHRPEYGADAYSVETHSIYIPYGKKFHFKNSKSAISFVNSRVNNEVLNHFDGVGITNWRGYRGLTDYLKNETKRSDENPIDEELAEKTLSF